MQYLENVNLQIMVTNMTIMWAKRVRKIKPYPAIPTEVKDYFLEPSDVDDMAVVDVVLISVSLCFIAGFVYGLLLGAIR
jgi:hypothetical protein